jgi:hypothetical protein
MAMATDRPTLEERYATASSTSDLTVDTHHSGADVILAAAMSHSWLGMALVHLRSEWDGCAKPPKRTEAQIEARAKELRDKHGKPDARRAKIEAMVWHATAMRERAAKLRGRAVVLGLLTEWALIRGIDVDLISPALFHWLSPTCNACDGLGKIRRPDAPVLGQQCNHCQGSGSWLRPAGSGPIHEHIADCLGKAKSGMAGKLLG